MCTSLIMYVSAIAAFLLIISSLVGLFLPVYLLFLF